MLLSLGLGLAGRAEAQTPKLTGAELERVGKGIWTNECNGSVSALSSWNRGENFASLGIGHFIWYPKGVEGPFEESFPMLLDWFRKNGTALPEWLQKEKDCPWPDKAAFDRDHNSERQQELRSLLSRTLREQVLFVIERLNQAVPKYRKAAGPDGARVEANIAALRQSAAGNFALIDYINFKGDGLNEKERYNGVGWGLLQVLIEMPASNAQNAPAHFAEAAKRVLSRRVQLSPPQRGETRWLKGWLNRCERYANWKS